jgi:hypothetical protein
MKRFVPLFMAVMLLIPVMAQAQRHRDRDRRDDRSERIGRVIRDCEDRTDDFLRAVQRSWGRERHSGDELDRSAAQLERSLNRVRDAWNRDHDYERTRRNVGAAIAAGREVNRILRRHRLGSRVEREWGPIKNELNNLAEGFEQPKIRW